MTTDRAAGAFADVVATILEDYYAHNPAEARRLGLHALDGVVPDRSETAITDRARAIESDIDRLEQFSDAALSEDERFDRDLLVSYLRAERVRLLTLRSTTTNPLFYADDVDLSPYILRDYAPLAQRVAAIHRHATAIPALLEQADRNLNSSLPRPALETAIGVFTETATFLRTDLRAVLDGGDIAGDAHEAVESAARALDAFVSRLNDRLPAATDAFAIGTESFRAMLEAGEMVDLPLAVILEHGERDLEANLERLRRTVDRIRPGADPRTVMAEMAERHPSADELVTTAASVLNDLHHFVVEHEIVDIPDGGACRVRKTPGFLRWAFAMIDPAGPYEPVDAESFYYITPPETDWPAERRESWLTNFDHASLRCISAHEVYPGHYVHFLNLRANPSPVRKLALAYSFIEGWAHYAEQMMIEEGYGEGDPWIQLAQLKEALIRDCRFIAAIKMHTAGMTLDEAILLFRDKAFADAEPAREEAVRGTFDPGYLNYTLGKLMLRKLRDDVRQAEGDRFSLRAFHDRLLALGAPPFPLARRALLGPNAGSVL